MSRFLLLLAVAALCLGSPLNLLLAVDWFVGPAGSDLNGGTSETDAFRTITHAMSVAANGDVIRVAPGTYDAAAGEVFPINMVGGVTLQGPDIGPARLLSDAQQYMFLVDGTSNPTVIANMFLDNSTGSGAWSMIRLQNYADDFTLSNCTLRTVGLILRDRMVAWTTSATPRPTTLTVVGNVAVDGPGSAGLARGMYVTASTSVHTHQITVTDNTLYGVGRLLDLFVETAGVIDLNVLDNQVIGAAWGGMVLELSASYSSSITVNGAIEGNDFFSPGYLGLDLSAYAWSSNEIHFNAPIRFNRVEAALGRGMALDLSADTGPVTAGPFEGNLIRGNSTDGVNLYVHTYGGLLVPFDMGGGAAGVVVGRNTLMNNGGMDLRCYGNSTAILPATGNWWGSTDPVLIEDRISHQADNSFQPLVDFSNPLAMSFTLGLSRQKVKQGGGTKVIVTARPEGIFVPRCGSLPLQVTLGGEPVRKLAVSPSGRRLGFKSPEFDFTGPVDLVVINPNGSVATRQMLVVP